MFRRTVIVLLCVSMPVWAAAKPGLKPMSTKGFTATASRSLKTQPPKLAFDGNTKTRWSTGGPMVKGDWFALDLGKNTYVSSIVFYNPLRISDFPKEYEVRISSDGKTWSAPVVKGTAQKSHKLVVKFSDPKLTRHIKIINTYSGTTGNWLGLEELYVYGRTGATMKQRLEETKGREPNPEEGYAVLFGNEEKKALASADPKDDAELANMMITALNDTNDRPRLQMIIFDKAYKLGSKHPAGYDAAIAAMQTLKMDLPERAAECEEKILKLRELKYRSAKGKDKMSAGTQLLGNLMSTADLLFSEGEASNAVKYYTRAMAVDREIDAGRAWRITQKLDTARDLSSIESQLKNTREALKKDPGDVEARNGLIRLYIVSLDNPAGAQKLLTEEVIREYRDNVPPAVEPVDEATEDICLQLGKWYCSLAQSEKRTTFKKAMLQRAKQYTSAFEKLHPKKDIQYLRAKIVMDKVQKEFDDLMKSAMLTSGWLELYPLIETNKHCSGNWTKQDGKLTHTYKSSIDHQHIEIPARPTGNFRYRIRFKNHKLTRGIWISFPVGEKHRAVFNLDSRNSKMGLGKLNEQSWTYLKNPTLKKIPTIKPGATTEVELYVTCNGPKAGISVKINDREYINWNGKPGAFPESSCRHVNTGFSRCNGTFTSPAIWAVTGRLVPYK